MSHSYDVRCACEDCVRQTLANRHGSPQEREIIGAGQQIGNVSSEHEVTGNPQAPNRSSGYGG